MSLETLVELLGEAGAAVAGGLVIGALFGAAAQRSRFCLRSAVIEFVSGALGSKVAVWLLAFGAALATTQLLVATAALDLSQARQLAARASLSGAALGGLMVGIGMILARGCPSRLLVLSATGNLRALLSGLVFAVVAQASLRGALAPAREALAGLWVIDGGEANSLLALLRLDSRAGLLLGLGCLLAAAAIALRSRLPRAGWIGALGVGAAIACAWLFTYGLSITAFEPVSVKGISFSGPSADVLMLFLSPAGTAWTFDVGLVPGVALGSFLAAAWARELRLETFRDGAPGVPRYVLGAALMGFGAMLAGGCAVGAGVSGGAVLALASWVALAAMWLGAGLAHLLVDRGAVGAAPTGGLALAVR